jgi:hypothetical protein
MSVMTTAANAPVGAAAGVGQAGAGQVSRARAAAAARPARAAGPPPGRQQQRSQQGGQKRRGGTRRPASSSGGGTNYQAVILGEFVTAILLVAATPFAKKDSPGISPYAGSDVLQLAAITITFFLLALVSSASTKGGRVAAWFGALILLTVGLGEAARLAKLLNVFGLSSPPPAGSLAPTPPGPPGDVHAQLGA